MGKGHKTRHKRGVEDIGQKCLEEFERRQQLEVVATVKPLLQLPKEPKYNSNKQPPSKYDHQDYRR